jgi:hypothetical protein
METAMWIISIHRRVKQCYRKLGSVSWMEQTLNVCGVFRSNLGDRGAGSARNHKKVIRSVHAELPHPSKAVFLFPNI